METYQTWVRLFELQRYYSWIIDRFHISTQMYQLRRYGKHYDFSWLEERLLPLGFRLVFCNRTPESFAAARASAPTHTPSPSSRARSRMTTQSAPGGRGAPVMTREVSSGPTGERGVDPAATRSTSRRRTGRWGVAAARSAERAA